MKNYSYSYKEPLPLGTAQLSLYLLLILLSFSGPSLAQAKASISLVAPNWNMSFQPLLNASNAPKLKVEEYAIVDQLKPWLEQANYSKAMLQLTKQWPSKPSSALHYIRAQIATQLKQYAAAERDYLDSIKIHGNYILALQSLAGIKLSQQKYPEAQQYLSKTIALGGSSADLFGQLAYLNLRFYSAFSAVSAYQRAYALEPQNKHWQRGLLMALTQSGSHQQANSLIDELLKTSANDKQLWLYKANAALANEDNERALQAMEVALRLGEKQPQNLQIASQLHLKSGNVKRAIDLISHDDSALKDYSFVRSMLSWLVRNDRWLELKQLINRSKSSRRHYQAQDLSHWYTQRSQLALHQGSYKTQQKLLLQAVDIDPGNGEALLLLAKNYRQQNKINRADSLLSRASVFSEYREAALFERVQIAYQRQHYRAAFELMKKILQIKPARRDLIENMDVLQRLIRQQKQDN